MRILTIIGTQHKGNTRAIVDLFLDEFKDSKNEFDEIVLPHDLPEFCCGCHNCIYKGENYCPHYSLVAPIVDKMVKADLIIIATPIFAMSCTSGLKTLLDHLSYMWFLHRPNENMFKKVGLIIATAGGPSFRNAIRLLKMNMFYWGIPKTYSYSISAITMNGDYVESKNKDKIKLQVHKKSKKITRSLNRIRVGIKTRFIFSLFAKMQKKGWNKIDVNYWRDKGWVNGGRPY